MKAFGGFCLIVLFTATALAQEGKFDKKAISLVQRTPVSTLEESMPRQPFADWFAGIIGTRAGIVWQLGECEQAFAVRGPGGDPPACVETNAMLSDGRKVIVKVAVGTFKKGISGDPGFFYAVIERGDQFLVLNRLQDLATGIQSPEKLADNAKPRLMATVNQSPPRLEVAPNLPKEDSVAAPPPPVAEPARETPAAGPTMTLAPTVAPAAAPNKISTGALMGKVLEEVGPVYPPDAKRVNAWGDVQVLLTISETGLVIEARAISGHLLLRKSAVTAARQWRFVPSFLNGNPHPVQGIITFEFPHP